MLLGERLRNQEAKEVVRQVISMLCKWNIDTNVMYGRTNKRTVELMNRLEEEEKKLQQQREQQQLTNQGKAMDAEVRLSSQQQKEIEWKQRNARGISHIAWTKSMFR